MMPRVPSLRARFLAAGLPKTAGLRFLEAIAGRRLATVATVLGQLVFQDLDPSLQRADDLRQAGKGGHDGVFALAVQSPNFIRSG
jgi:hypothetical protein